MDAADEAEAEDDADDDRVVEEAAEPALERADDDEDGALFTAAPPAVFAAVKAAGTGVFSLDVLFRTRLALFPAVAWCSLLLSNRLTCELMIGAIPSSSGSQLALCVSLLAVCVGLETKTDQDSKTHGTWEGATGVYS